MSRKAEYRRYLSSSAWREKRDLALARTSGFCQFCGSFAEQVHHVRYPKQFGQEDQNSLVPVCDECHKTSHGIHRMTALTNALRMKDFSPTGRQFKYLVSNARVFASAKSWISALQMPDSMTNWFTTSLRGQAILKSKPGDPLEMIFENTPVYRWHAVAEALRAFDRSFYQGKFKDKPTNARRDIERLHENYEKLVSWGYDLQERALAGALNAKNADPSAPISQADLLAIVKEIVAPRLRAHDDKLEQHDVVIAELEKAVPVLRDQNEFISIKQAIGEQGYDETEVPLYPQSRENLAGLAGRLLRDRG
ncbi:MAG: HNH endonuclease, partial [bacterium]